MKRALLVCVVLASVARGEELSARTFVGAPAQSPAFGQQFEPRVVFDETQSQYVVTWIDRRRDVYTDVYFARVSSLGVVLDPAGKRLGSQAMHHTLVASPVGVFSAWATNAGNPELEACLFDGVMTPRCAPLVTGPGEQSHLVAAWAGSGFALAWRDYTNDTLNLAQVSPLLAVDGKSVTRWGGSEVGLAASDAGVLLVSVVGFSDGGSALESRLFQFVPDGGVGTVPDAGVSICKTAGEKDTPFVTWVPGDQRFVVAWEDGRSGPASHHIALNVLLPDGTPEDGGDGALLNSTDVQARPVLGPLTDGRLGVSWEDSRDYGSIWAMTVSRDAGAGSELRVSDPSNRGNAPSVACHPTQPECLLAYEGAGDIYALRYAPGGSGLGSPFPVSMAGGQQGEPTAAFNGHHLLVFEEYRGLNRRGGLHGLRLYPDGKRVEAQSFVVIDGPEAETSPQLATDGTRFFVLYERDDVTPYDSSQMLWGAVLGTDGRAPPDAGFLVATGGLMEGNVMFDGAAYQVVWTATSGDSVAIFRRPYGPTGVPLLNAGVVLVADSMTFLLAPKVVRGAGVFLLVYRRGYDGVGDIYGRLFDANWVPRGASFPISLAMGEDHAPDVVFDGTNFVVAWHQRAPLSGDMDIVATRVTPAGVLLDTPPAPLARLPGDQVRVRLAVTNGDRVWAAWDDLDVAPDRDVRITRLALGADGGLLAVSPGGKPLMVTPEPEGDLTVSVSSQGHVLFGVEAFDGTPAVQNMQVAWTMLFDLADGARCTSGPQCLSGQCVAGCCGAACPLDAGVVDGGAVAADGGAGDGGSAADGGTGEDGGVEPDRRHLVVACGCTTGDATGALALAALLLSRRRTRGLDGRRFFTIN